MATAKSGAGILIGRFQVFELNKEHKKRINKLLRRHRDVHVFLGTNPAPSDMNPMDWVFRADLFLENYISKVEVHEMPDLPDDRIWSQELDRRILELRLEGDITLYGTEQGFIERYSGRYRTERLETEETSMPDFLEEMGAITDIRSFRAGMLFAAARRFPTVYPTVDIAVFRNERREVMLARKDNETKYRFPGGFSDPSDESYEMAAMRELLEECGDIEVEELIYLGSAKIDDWRYRFSADGVMTHLYACNYVQGEPVASDDISEIRWFEVKKLKADSFIYEHRVLWELLSEFLEEENL